MNKKIEEIMRNHGLHKNISQDCQHRIEMLSELIIEECIEAARTVGGNAGVEVETIIRNRFGAKNE